MKTDIYTKTILTVIAICLVILVGKEVEIIPSAKATDVKEHFRLVPVNPDGSINVKVAEVVDVQIRGINESSLPWEAIKVEVE